MGFDFYCFLYICILSERYIASFLVLMYIIICINAQDGRSATVSVAVWIFLKKSSWSDTRWTLSQ